MPLYEYHCPDCNHDFEALVRSDERAECPTCGTKKLEKLLSVPAAHVAGSSSASLPMSAPAPGGFCGRGTCGMPGCGPG